MKSPHWKTAAVRDDGTVTGYTVITTLAVLAFAGLVLDAGLAVSTKVDAVSVAQSSARRSPRTGCHLPAHQWCDPPRPE